MAAYDEDLHHIGLGPVGDVIEGYTLSGGYRTELQREASPMEFGGTFDVESAPGHSRWTQDDFSGGQYQYIWGKDPAMFRSCRSFRPMMFERTLVTIPPFIDSPAGTMIDQIPNYFPGAGATQPGLVPKPLLVYNINEYIYSLWPEEINATSVNIAQKLLKVHFAGAVGGSAFTLANVPANCAALDRADAILYVGNETNRRLDRWNPTTGAAASPANYAYPNGVGNRELVHMNADGPNITCIFGRMIADLTIPDDVTTAVAAGSKYWVVNKRYRLPGRCIDSLYYNSTLYLLVSDTTWDKRTRRWSGGWNTWVFSWNGADLLPVVHFPFTFRGMTIVEYAGRLFVGGYGADFNAAETYGELYEIQASSIRAVRSFASEHRTTHGGALPATKIIDNLVVWEGLLWFVNDEAEVVECYDITTDAFYGGPATDAVGSLGYRIDGLIPVNSTLCLLASGISSGTRTAGVESGDFLSNLKNFHIPNSGTTDVAAEIVTSDFCVEPDLKKVWNSFTILTKGGAVSALYSSTDGGETWDGPHTPFIVESDGDWEKTIIPDLSFLEPSERICFKITFNRTDPIGFTELVAYTATFNFVSTGKKAWSMAIWGVDQPETVDGEKETQNTRNIKNALFGYAQSNEPLEFIDVHGDTHIVRLVDVSETLPVLGDPIPGSFGSFHREGVYAVTLLQV